jgi:hypothetical protein
MPPALGSRCIFIPTGDEFSESLQVARQSIKSSQQTKPTYLIAFVKPLLERRSEPPSSLLALLFRLRGAVLSSLLPVLFRLRGSAGDPPAAGTNHRALGHRRLMCSKPSDCIRHRCMAYNAHVRPTFWLEDVFSQLRVHREHIHRTGEECAQPFIDNDLPPVLGVLHI